MAWEFCEQERGVAVYGNRRLLSAMRPAPHIGFIVLVLPNWVKPANLLPDWAGSCEVAVGRLDTTARYYQKHMTQKLVLFNPIYSKGSLCGARSKRADAKVMDSSPRRSRITY